MTKKTALILAVDLLASRAYGTEELKFKLQNKGYTGEDIDDAIQILTKRGYLDDATLCITLFESYCRKEKYSLNYIAQKLMQKGFSLDLVEQCKNQMLCTYERKVAEKIFLQKYRPPYPMDVKIMMRYLYSKGFKEAVVKEVISSYVRCEENHEDV